MGRHMSVYEDFSIFCKEMRVLFKSYQKYTPLFFSINKCSSCRMVVSKSGVQTLKFIRRVTECTRHAKRKRDTACEPNMALEIRVLYMGAVT